VFLLVKENHTFDSLFAPYLGANGSLTATLSTGQVINRPLAPVGPLASDLNHAHSAAVTEYRNGAMNGFDLVAQGPASDAGTASPFIYYDRSLIPNYYSYADNFVLCDNFFATNPGPSFPGYLALMAAQSPAYSNPNAGAWNCTGTGTAPAADPSTCALSLVPPCFDIPSVASILPPSVTWREYGGSYFGAFRNLTSTAASHTRPYGQFQSDVATGDIANITYIWGGAASEHPPQYICPGENDTVKMVNEVMQSSVWNRSVFIVTYDDYGGFYDHVPPAVDLCPGGGFFHPGFRLPTMIISPFARKGFVLHALSEQASIPRLIEDIFGLPRLASSDRNARDARAGDLMGAFDFSQAPRAAVLLTPRTCP
jgi:phospholipase C